MEEKSGGKDPAGKWRKKVASKANKVTCNYCENEYDGITRFKKHLAHTSENVKECALIPDNMKQKASVT